MKRKGRKLMKKVFALMLALVMAVPTVDYGAFITVEAAGEISVLKSGGYEEGAYVEWEHVNGAEGYYAYVSKDNTTWTRLDDELIRSYGDYLRVDALGLTAGSWSLKVEAVTLDSNKEKVDVVAEKIETLTVTAHDRSGYAWYEGGTASGAYNEDGSLKDDANVIYITNANKDDVGLQNIIYDYKQGTATVPLDVRLIGNIEDFKEMEDGDIVIETYGNIGSKGITIEGVGEDAVANGWGIRIKNAVNVEIRNLGFMNCNSKEGDNVSVQQNDAHIWVHHCDFFYGHAGDAADQKKGDGMLDCKESDLITFSYNHFWDSGKSCLLGLEEGINNPNFVGRITYHHNWFDHSDSRHPRIRYYTTHIYNNYYDGNSKYGIGAAEGGTSVFAESNYFRNCKYPMLISQQGSDIAFGSGNFAATDKAVEITGDTNENGSMIKAYGNFIEGGKSFIPYKAPKSQDSSVQSEEAGFVAYVAVDDLNEESDKVSGDDILNEDTNEASDDDNANEDADEVSDADNTNADIGSISDEDNINDNINDNTPDEFGDDNANKDTDEVSEDNNTDVNTDEETDYDEAGEESDLEAEVSFVQAQAFTNDASVDFDAYVVDNRNDTVPDTVKTKKGGFTYNNFDTANNFYQYTPDNAEDVPNKVKAHAGRVNGGDFKFTFTEADDESSDVNEALKTKCTNYTSSLVAVGGVNGETTKAYLTVTFDPGNGDAVTTVKVEANTAVNRPEDPTKVPEGKVKFDNWYNGFFIWDFSKAITKNITLKGIWLAEGEEAGSYGPTPIGTEKVIHDFTTQGMESDYFGIEGVLNTSGGSTYKYEEVEYKSGGGKGRLDMCSKDNPPKVIFSTTIKSKIVLFLANNKNTKKVNIDDKPLTQAEGVIVTTIEPGKHTITRNQDNYLYAIWVVPILNVNFDVQGGSAIASQTVESGKLCNEPTEAPTKDGHTFGGWYTDKTYTTEYNFDDPVTSNITLYAKFTPEGSYAVAFDTQGGPKIEAQFVENGKAAIKPEDPTKEGYVFGGWYRNSECTADSEYDFTTPVTEDIKLYANWKKQYIVTFDTDGGSVVESQTVIEGQKCSKPANPTKKDYTFAGWFTDSTCTDESKYDFSTPVTSNITLYAKWIEDGTGNQDSNGFKIEFANKNEVYTYTGSAIKPDIIVNNNGKVLVEGSDYTVKYSNNVKASAAAQIIVTGKGVYAGKTAPKKFAIAKKDIDDTEIKAGRIVVVKSKKVPTPVLYYGGTKLTAKDFELKVKNKTFSAKSDNETITIKGINNFDGERDIKVVVVENSTELKKAAQKFTVEVNNDALKKLTYTGSSLEDEIKACITKVSDKTTGTKLESGQYEIAFPKNVTNAGKVKFTIVGMEEYSGCNVVKTCTILPRAINGSKKAGEALSDSDVVITGITNSLDYISTGATFEDLSITWTNKARNDEGLEPLSLIEGRDYKLSYSANKKVGSNAKCTIIFKGNYKGKPVVNFSVTKTELNADTVDIINKDTDNEKMVLIADKVCNGKKGVYKSTPYLSVNNVLVKASEYDVKYYTDADMNSEMTKDKPLDFGTNPCATVYVKITAKTSSKNFKTTQGTTPITGSYKVWVKEKKSDKVDLSKAKVVFYNGSTKTTKLPYTGGVVVPDKIEVTVGGKKVAETYYSYDVIANVNKGKATVVVYAKDNTNCIGGKVVTYNIAAHSLNNYNW